MPQVRDYRNSKPARFSPHCLAPGVIEQTCASVSVLCLVTLGKTSRQEPALADGNGDGRQPQIGNLDDTL